MKYYKLPLLVIALLECSSVALADDVTGAGLGATTGGSRTTSTTPPLSDDPISGAANVGSATPDNGVLSIETPSRADMVSSGSIADVDADAEDHYWEENYTTRPYYKSHAPYTTYQDAYAYGVDVYHEYGGWKYKDIDQKELRAGWADSRGDSPLNWKEAEPAVRDAYQRLYDRDHTNSDQ